MLYVPNPWVCIVGVTLKVSTDTYALCSWYWYKLAITGRLLKRLLQISKVYFKVKPGRPGGLVV